MKAFVTSAFLFCCSFSAFADNIRIPIPMPSLTPATIYVDCQPLVFPPGWGQGLLCVYRDQACWVFSSGAVSCFQMRVPPIKD